jgi:hypothetical protein
MAGQVENQAALYTLLADITCHYYFPTVCMAMALSNQSATAGSRCHSGNRLLQLLLAVADHIMFARRSTKKLSAGF